MPTTNKPTGIVLAGGHSRRFGRDKALAVLPAHTTANAVLAVHRLLPVTTQVFVAANHTNRPALQQLLRAEPQVHVCVDQPDYPDCGPLSGLFAVTATQPQSCDYLLLATDYPDLTAELVTGLAQQPQSYLATTIAAHYAIAHFVTDHQQVAAFLASGQRRLQDFLIKTCQCRPLMVPDAPALHNLNYRPH